MFCVHDAVWQLTNGAKLFYLVFFVVAVAFKFCIVTTNCSFCVPLKVVADSILIIIKFNGGQMYQSIVLFLFTNVSIDQSKASKSANKNDIVSIFLVYVVSVFPGTQ